MRARTVVALVGWVGGVASCSGVLGWDLAGYDGRTGASASGGSGGAGGAGGAGGRATTTTTSATGGSGGGAGGAIASGGADAGSTTTSGCVDDCRAQGGWCDEAYGWCVYDWARWKMPTWKGSGLGNEPVYTVKGDVVKDEITGLVWQRHAEDAACAGSPTCTWYEAHVYCHDLALDGGGWRLPSTIELLSLVDYSTADPAHARLDAAAFPEEPPGNYWSSSCYKGPCSITNPKVQKSAFFVDFFGGTVSRVETTNAHHVRCVR